MRIVRKTFRVVLILTVLGLAGAVALFFWLRTSLPQIEGDVAVEGLVADVEILRDEWGIPHIFAQSPRDAYFGLGFAHAQDRFFQMEMQRRGAQGRISELVGSLAIERDRFLRLLDLYRASRSSFATLSPETRETLEAYAAGVNAWLATHDGPPAPELALLLADQPEAWQPADSVSWLKIMALLLAGNWREEALHAAIAERLGPEKAASFFPAFRPGSPTILETAEGIDFTALASLFDRLLGTPGKGSNNWAVSGEHTASGYPLLANDPHLGYGIPSVWYLAHLEAPGLSVTGATLPGMPLVVIGTNGRIAWSLSNTGPDTQDLFIERRDPDDANRYLAPDGPEPFAVREETIVVRFGTDEQVTMLETRHGPVLTGIVDRLPGDAGDEEVLALAWTMLHDDDRSMESALALHTAQNWQEFTAIARFYAGPMQNIIYADGDGNIGLLAPGFVPVRRSGNGRLPVEGWTGESDWLGRIPFHDLPRVLDPPSGILAAANNRLVGGDYPYFLSHRWEPGYRAGRIREVLGSHSRHDLESFTRLQLDNRSGLAEAFLDHALSRRTADRGRTPAPGSPRGMGPSHGCGSRGAHDLPMPGIGNSPVRSTRTRWANCSRRHGGTVRNSSSIFSRTILSAGAAMPKQVRAKAARNSPLQHSTERLCSFGKSSAAILPTGSGERRTLSTCGIPCSGSCRFSMTLRVSACHWAETATALPPPTMPSVRIRGSSPPSTVPRFAP